MNYKYLFLSTVILSMLFNACSKHKNNFDASGAFEAIETIISSEASGVLLEFSIEEGQELLAGQAIGFIDTTTLYLKKKQLLAQIQSIGSRNPNIVDQTGFYDDQLKLIETQMTNLENEQRRFQNLVSGNAAPQKQLDDINAKLKELTKQMSVIKQQKVASISALSTQKNTVGAEPLQIYTQIEQVDYQLKKCHLINPINGTVLTKYAEQNEVTAAGKPLYKVADLSNIILKAYITGNQLPNVQLNQKVTVLTDDGKDGFNETDGVITWINDKAEFTPKTIQTKDERANLVYAIKVSVKNSGFLKIGMYGEIKFQ